MYTLCSKFCLSLLYTCLVVLHDDGYTFCVQYTTQRRLLMCYTYMLCDTVLNVPTDIYDHFVNFVFLQSVLNSEQ